MFIQVALKLADGEESKPTQSDAGRLGSDLGVERIHAESQGLRGFLPTKGETGRRRAICGGPAAHGREHGPGA